MLGPWRAHRWLALGDTCVNCHPSPPTEGSSVAALVPGRKDTNSCLSLSPQYYFTVLFGHEGQKPLELRCEEEQDGQEWMEAIHQARWAQPPRGRVTGSLPVGGALWAALWTAAQFPGPAQSGGR